MSNPDSAPVSPLIVNHVIPLVLRLVAAAYEVTVSELRTSTRATRLSEPRRVAWWIVREMTGAQFEIIARVSGDFHHTSVIHGCNKVEHQRKKLPFVRDSIDAVWALAVDEAEQTIGKGALRAPGKRAA